jgi:hypothetical protein
VPKKKLVSFFRIFRWDWIQARVIERASFLYEFRMETRGSLAAPYGGSAAEQRPFFSFFFWGKTQRLAMLLSLFSYFA